MGFTKLSSELSVRSSVRLDNIFVLEFMPFAPENYTKVYIYGKMLAEGNGANDNTPERLAHVLGITEDEVMAAFRYFEEQGLVRITAVPPFEVEYIPVRYVKPSQKKFSKHKYAAFNEMLMRMFPNREFLPSEYNEYYSVIEDCHIETDAMLAIISYCAKLKGKSIGWKYIVTVARNMAADGCRTLDEVESKLATFSILSDDISRVFKSLKIKRAQEFDDIRLYKKWTEELGFAPATVFKVADGVFGEMKGLDTVLARYYADGLINLDEIERFKKARDRLLKLTKELLIKLDVRYNHLDYYAETYVKEWLKLGFEAEGLKIIADYCFRHNRKSCESMKNLLLEIAAEGRTDLDVIKERYSSEGKFGAEIKRLLELAGVTDDVTSRDRDSYNIWTNYWHISAEMLELAATMSKGDANPRAKMFMLIKEWRNSKADSPAKARKATEANKAKSAADLNKKLLSIKPEDM